MYKKLSQNKEFRKKFDNVTLGCQLAMFEKFIDEEYNKLIREREDKPVDITVHLEDIKYNPGLYRNFYKNSWFDLDTKEFISTYISLNISEN